MITKENQLKPGAPDHRKRNVDPSRRRFIQAAAAGAVAATVPLAVFEVESWLVAEGKDHEHEVEMRRW